jgi:hypothetical protein
MNELYSDTAKIGTIQSTVSFGVSIVLCVALVIVGVYLLFIKKQTYIETNGTILKAECHTESTTISNRTTLSTLCSLTVTYTVDNKNYTNVVTVGEQYNKGDNIKLMYNPKNPNEVNAEGINVKYIGGGLLVVGIIVLLGSWYNYYMVTHFKAYAAAQGTADVASAFLSNV